MWTHEQWIFFSIIPLEPNSTVKSSPILKCKGWVCWSSLGKVLRDWPLVEDNQMYLQFESLIPGKMSARWVKYNHRRAYVNVHDLWGFLFLKGSCVAFLFTVTVNALEGKDCKESVKLIAESTNLSEEQLAFLISGMYTLLREALRLPLSTFKQEVSSGPRQAEVVWITI